ncbi:1-phosphofructokinase family hexose kinase [Kitasatospora sp. NPDC096147]|uniref:1-phosphofructokinase family hexose kinase n=1 Tax=Kitasatospora sp. NPDC096147 TaxID=3364093 RepID=UPI003801C627
MILTVTLNAALDVTYHLPRVARFGSNRVPEVAEQAGGKGVNVARVLRALGAEVAVTGLAGGATGLAIRQELGRAGLRDELVAVGGESRRTIAVVEQEDGDATMYLEPGPVVTEQEWRAFRSRFAGLLAGAGAVVLSGSLPRGLPVDAYRELVELARAGGVPAVLDADGPALAAGLTARPALVKPNRKELAAVAGIDDPVAGARVLLAAGAEAVAASLGPDGLLVVTERGGWLATPPEPVPGNPTGAGDAAVAALTLGLVRDEPWPDRLRRAVALSAATVLAPRAGEFDGAAYRRWLDRVRVEPLPVRTVSS